MRIFQKCITVRHLLRKAFISRDARPCVSTSLEHWDFCHFNLFRYSYFEFGCGQRLRQAGIYINLKFTLYELPEYMYKITLLPDAQDSFKNLDKTIQRKIAQKIDWLAENADKVIHHILKSLPDDLRGLCKVRVGSIPDFL